VLSIATIADAVPQTHDVCTTAGFLSLSLALLTVPKARLLWLRQSKQNSATDIRRSLFELHAGREAPNLHAALPLDEVKRPGSDKDDWFNTSEQLIGVLGPAGQDYARPKEYERMLDLSFADPLQASLDREGAIKKAQEAIDKQKLIKDQGRQGESRKEILISYLQHVDPVLRYQARLDDPDLVSAQLNDGLNKVFDKKTSRWLKAKGLDITDVMNWTWVLTADIAERAALRLVLLADTSSEHRKIGKAVPQFLFTFLLRRISIGAHALKPLLILAWRLLEDSESSAVTSPKERPLSPTIEHSMRKANTIVEDGTNGMAEHIFLIIIIRLLRRARKVWPAACESIVALVIRYLDGINFRKPASRRTSLQPDDIDQLTYVYNTMLRLLSLPSPMHPFQSAIHQQRAQFSLLRRMDQFNPPLVVDKRGYQAVVKIQLMHKKTLREREWAHMKAKSWPPWKEEKLGMDARIGPEHGISRAKEALTRGEEAGYSTDNWDATAGILSGWDTDGSPTIQVRSTLKYPLNVPKQTKESSQVAIWAARVQATRTLGEAWSCFLAWKDQTGAAFAGQPVYFEMVKKIVSSSRSSSWKSTQTTFDAWQDEGSLGGDGLEVVPAPETPGEAVYVRRPPPDVDELFEMMKEDGIKPSGRLLALLVAKASSLEAGVKYLEASILQPQHLAALLSDDLGKDPTLQQALRSIPKPLFTAFIELLTRFAPTRPGKHDIDPHDTVETDRWSPTVDTDLNEYSQFNSLAKAFELLLARKLSYRPAWYHVFRALVRTKAVTGVYSRHVSQNKEDIKTWRMLSRLLDCMLDIDLGLDLDGFAIICLGLEKAIFASERELRYEARFRIQSSEAQGFDDHVRHSTHLEHRVLSRDLPLIKELFKDAVRSTGMQQEIPSTTIIDQMDAESDAEDKQDKNTSDDESDETEEGPSDSNQAFLPPACLLPKLLEVPHPAHLHAFIRVLGLRRDYDGIVDLVEWMSLFADEIDGVVEEAKNGRRMMRRCMTAIRVFLERSWMNIPRDDGCNRAGYGGIIIEANPAPSEIIRAVRDVILENKRWGGWATTDEIVEYCSKGKFL